MLKTSDQRKYRRIDTDCPLHYQAVDGSSTHEGRCINLSGNGLLFHGPVAVEAGRALEVSVLPDNRLTPPLNAFVEVSRCSPDGDGFEIAATIKAILGN